MAKYTEAFCVTTGSMISIMQMRSEYNHDPAIYEKVYKGHLFCPGCQAVPLTVVHTNGQLYYRGHPHEEHADGCWYALDERVVKSVTEINGDSEEQALSQLDSLLRATFKKTWQSASCQCKGGKPQCKQKQCSCCASAARGPQASPSVPY